MVVPFGKGVVPSGGGALIAEGVTGVDLEVLLFRLTSFSDFF